MGTEHSPRVAGVVEWLLPTAGFAYVGDWTRGFLPNAVRIGTVIGLYTTEDEGDGCEGACVAWGIGAVTSTIWAIVGAVDTANDHNARSGRRSRRSHSRGPGGTTMVGLLALALLAATLAATPSHADAQDRWPFSFELGLGLTAGRTTGEFRDNDGGLSVEALLGARVLTLGTGAVFAAANAGIQGNGPTEDAAICLPSSDGGCIPRFPHFQIFSLLGGWESASTAY